jgi:hypothetical protein
MRWAVKGVPLAACATVAAGILLLAAPGHAGLVGHVWLVVVLAIALGVALDRLRAAVPDRASAFDGSFAPTPLVRARPASLARVEREVALATGTAFDVHFRLRPVLRGVAQGLLLRRGVDLERSPDRARSLLDVEVWELIRPDREPPLDRTAPGLEIVAIERAVDDLERLACS